MRTGPPWYDLYCSVAVLISCTQLGIKAKTPKMCQIIVDIIVVIYVEYHSNWTSFLEIVSGAS